MQVRVRDLMTVNPVSVLTGTSLQEAATQMILAESAEIYVINQRMRLIGIVPDYEILKHKLMHQHLDDPIDSIMHVQLESLSPEDDALQLAHLFRDRRNSCMAVTEHGQLVGKLSCRDLFRTILTLESIESTEEQAAEPDSQVAAETNSAVSSINPPHLSRYNLRKEMLQLNGPKSE
ncbi:CBS domain-containing protein [uncultured Gimesia sp.]|uniref:CBS domain-containing protein n=1 Tax=uncultured Gimesia sp. TaxID=1678688 RepID=UPI0030DC386D